jgi:hypothetical protein
MGLSLQLDALTAFTDLELSSKNLNGTIPPQLVARP